MTFSFCDMDYSESSVEKKKKVNKTMFQICSLLFYKLTIVPQIQRRLCPTAGWQPRKSGDLDEPCLRRQKVSLLPFLQLSHALNLFLQLVPRHSPVLTRLVIRVYAVH